MMTVAELIRDLLPPGTSVLSGEEALDREVTWSARPRPSPPAFGHLSGGELVLINVSRLSDIDERLTLEGAVRQLAAFGVTAVAAAGRISAAAKSAAEKGGVVLLQLPATADLGDLERAASHVIGERRREEQRRGQDAGRRLMEIAISGEPLHRVLSMLQAEARQAVALERRDGGLLVYLGGTGLPSRDEAERLLGLNRAMVAGWLAVSSAASPAEPPTTRSALDGAWERTLAPVIGRNGVLGALSLIGRRGSVALDDGPILSRAAAASAIVLGREHATLAARREIELNVLDEVLDGALRNEVTLLQQARRLGHELTEPHQVMVIHIEESANGIPPAGAILGDALARRRMHALWRTHEDHIELLLASDAVNDSLDERLHADLTSLAPGAAVTVGVGGAGSGLAGIQRSHGEARQALGIGRQLFGPGGVTRFERLGIYRLIFAAAHLPELRALHDEALASLIAYDRRHGAELVKTLHAFLDANGGPKEAAQLLGVHRNTVLYRLDRVREVTGVDLDSAETRLQLHLALSINLALAATGESGA